MNEYKEYIEFIQDCKECTDRINNFECYPYIETELWAIKKYENWLKKDKRYALALAGGNSVPNSDRDKAWNAINNFKITLGRIAMIKNYKM